MWHDASDSDERVGGWVTSGIRYEGKHTDHRSFTVTARAWEKITDEADDEGQEPALVVDLAATPGYRRGERHLVVVLSKRFYDALLRSERRLVELLGE